MKNINFTGTEGNIEIWANLSTENADLTEFDNRSQIVKNIVSIKKMMVKIIVKSVLVNYLIVAKTAFCGIRI